MNLQQLMCFTLKFSNSLLLSALLFSAAELCANTDIGLGSGNTLQQQSLLDNYYKDYGNGPVTAGFIDTAFVLSDTFDSKTLLDIQGFYIERLKTYIGGVGYTKQLNLTQNMQLSGHLAADYTRLDGLEFYQGVFGGALSHGDSEAAINFYIPPRSSNSYGSDALTLSDGQEYSKIIGVRGVDFLLKQSIDALTVGLKGSFFSDDSLKNDLSTYGLYLAFRFNDTLVLSGDYEVRQGLDSNDIGYNGRITIPLLRGSSVSKAPDITSSPVTRMIGSVIQGKSISCSAGESSYNQNGVASCETSNPFAAVRLVGASGAANFNELNQASSTSLSSFTVNHASREAIAIPSATNGSSDKVSAPLTLTVSELFGIFTR